MGTRQRIDVFPGSNDDAKFYNIDDSLVLASLIATYRTNNTEVFEAEHPAFGKVVYYIHYRKNPEIYAMFEDS